MKFRFNLEIFYHGGIKETTVIADYADTSGVVGLIRFYDRLKSGSDLIAAYPSAITAIVSIDSYNYESDDSSGKVNHNISDIN